ncbi:NUMOD4 domain-containing protein [Paenactinomyces guangxiensis]|uniref:NUMOD4 domain-containing protein n=1 Tax=Paenactinomyces guangxiensis TaxID=1490290 RepID=A0A7W2AAT0_9BACL|nr:NUMOD4 domain-containing protein [Paenactinomyces guangxiensis]MBA4496519.1 hypothetical protein [Paenactinomyces guangxiensis]MBH8593555.1 hypothetical protein [Paenactinomyces guangxiensis]
MSEIWKPIVVYEDRYAVSNYGRVKSLKRVIVNRRGVRWRRTEEGRGFSLLKFFHPKIEMR